jgi:hypothetical protein
LRKLLTITLLLSALSAVGTQPALGVSKETLEMMQKLEHIQALLESTQKAVADLKAQVDAMNAGGAKFEQNQEQLQAAIILQQHKLDSLEQLLDSSRIASEQNFLTLRTAVSDLRSEQQKAFSTLSGQTQVVTTEIPAPPPKSAAAATAAPSVAQGYVTVVQGDAITIDLGSTKGLHQGSRLAVFKAGDPKTQVGEVEVTDVVDGDNSHARIVQMSPGIKLEFSDIARME